MSLTISPSSVTKMGFRFRKEEHFDDDGDYSDIGSDISDVSESPEARLKRTWIAYIPIAIVGVLFLTAYVAFYKWPA